METYQSQVLDTRATVGHLTRNIKIKRQENLLEGYRLLTYGYKECNQSKTGHITLSGV